MSLNKSLKKHDCVFASKEADQLLREGGLEERRRRERRRRGRMERRRRRGEKGN